MYRRFYKVPLTDSRPSAVRDCPGQSSDFTEGCPGQNSQKCITFSHVCGAASSAPPGTARRRPPPPSCTAVAVANATTPIADSENRQKRAARLQQHTLPRSYDPNRFCPTPPTTTGSLTQSKILNLQIKLKQKSDM